MATKGRKSRGMSATLSVAMAFLLSCIVFLADLEAPNVLMMHQLSFVNDLHDSLVLRNMDPVAMCDYTSGEWVHTRREPLYSGKECKNWLSPMWACRLNPNRSYFDYETYRWKPDACSLPPFEPQSFLNRTKDKTIAFVGDSLGRQQFQSLMCLLTSGQDEDDNIVVDVGIEFGFPKYIKANKTINQKTRRPSSWAYRFMKTNTTILFSWSPTLCHLEYIPLEETNFTSDNGPANDNNQYFKYIAFHVDMPPIFLSSNLHKLDVIILNTGSHWNINKFLKNRWKLHVQRNPLEINMSVNLVKSYYNFTTHNLVHYLNMQVQMGTTKAIIFYRTLSPHHFIDGDWNSGGHCDSTHMNAKSIPNISKGDVIEFISNSIIHYTHIHLLNITWLSQLRDEAHISKYSLKAKDVSQDCLHWCLPGVPDTWNEILYAKLSHLIVT